MQEICRICADVCEACGAECRDHEADHCQRCADACEQCAKECRRMAGAAA
nr:four-helix bundle copper-binding protein [Candidatus Laterigemmans baculatus]